MNFTGRRHAAFSELKFEKGPETVTASFGVSTFTVSEDFDTILVQADYAFYSAKRSGKNQVRAAGTRPKPAMHNGQLSKK